MAEIGPTLLGMTKDELACWNLMAKSLRKVLPLIEAAADHECTADFHELPYRAMANGLSYVIALEELIRPVAQELAS
jgi:hypothetical protein